ncbi:MAG: Gfo/Idh/MocA family oxidoreductase, partial [Oscillospiraceae bacterium]|nr:Gfo/Idh/MocA family oxidoreductase [Oscillospiraceae bacterium]
LGADFEPCLDTLLKRDDFTAVICDAPTTNHREVMVKAANAGKHIFTEKALAPTVAECLEIKAAIEKSGVTFVISYPQRQSGIIQFAKRMIDQGELGKVSFVRYRNAHSGVSGNWLPKYWYNVDETAGGAMMDLGCHPMYIISYLCGKPKRIAGLFNELYNTGMDENSVAAVEFENGIIGVADTSFVVYNSPVILEVYGTEGSIIAVGGDVKFTSKKLNNYVGGFVQPTLPAGKPSPLMQFADACINGTGSPEGLGIDDAIALTELLELSYIANNKNEYQSTK